MTDAAAFQEILHRYAAIGRRSAIQPAFDLLRGVVDDVVAIDEQDVMAAKDILTTHGLLSAREALHVALMQRHGITTILSFDRALHEISGVHRIP